MQSADAIAEEIVQAILADRPARPKSALLLVNGFGATPAMELYLMYNAARRRLADSGVTVARSLVGNYVTSLDMAGCSITLADLDEDMLRLWDSPVNTAGLRWGM
jgi:dihydroxyacetone kinase-like protein